MLSHFKIVWQFVSNNPCVLHSVTHSENVGIGVFNAANKAPLTPWSVHTTSLTFCVVSFVSCASMNGLHFSGVPTQSPKKKNRENL